MAKKKSTTGNWLDGATEVPNPVSPGNKDRSKRQKFYRRFIIAAIVLLPIVLIANIAILGQLAQHKASVTSSATYSAQGKAAAIIDVQTWLAQTPSPLPGGGQLVAWDSGSRVAKPQLTAQQQQANPLPAYDIELHSLTVEDGLGQTYTVEVQVAVGDKIGAVALGEPSLIPVGNADKSAVNAASPWMGVTSAQAPQPVTTSIKTWLAAFTSGDPDALRVAIGDGNGKHSYVPLYNVQSSSMQVLNAAYLPDGSQSTDKAITQSNTMIVEISASIQWQGNSAPAAGTGGPQIVYDLLINKAESAAPVVVAWGGPGTGPSLTPYQNAISRSVIAPGSQATSTPSGSATGSSTPTATSGAASVLPGHGGTTTTDGSTASPTTSGTQG